MKLLQFHLPGKGLRAGLLRGNQVADLTALDPKIDSVLTLFQAARQQKVAPSQAVADRLAGQPVSEYDFSALDIPPDEGQPHLLIPIIAPEVWAFGVTYKRSAETRDSDAGVGEGIYDRVYRSARPECFFKATPSRCVGPNGPIGIRSDSTLTAAEPELAYILGEAKQILGYTICNDVSAWDLERENPLYLPQSKTYTGCCALGPVIVTPDEMADPMNLAIACRILRNGETIYEGETHSSRIGRSLTDLNEYLYRHNPIPFGTAVTTGTGIMVPNEHHLIEGDRVEIDIESIGRLANRATRLSG